MKYFFYLLALPVVLGSCSKEGSGGTSSITGKVTMRELLSQSSEPEVFHITCTQGAIIDDNDYILLNTPSGPNYYLWFDNTNWAGGDPALAGRTGIKVIYDFTQSNTTLATNTAAAIQTIAGSDYSVSVTGDIITLTCTENGAVVDAQDINSPFTIDVENQGKGGSGGITTNAIPAADERVYLIYGEEDFYSESVRTDAEGNFQFKDLRKGDYRVYVFSYDTLSLTTIQLETQATILKNKEVVQASTLSLIK